MFFYERILKKVLDSPKSVAVAIVVLFLLGASLYNGLKVDLFPPLNFPVLNVITEIPSFSSVEMERQVTRPIEGAVTGVLGVTHVRSTSATGISMVSVSFQWGTDMLTSRQLLIEALSAIRGQLPKEAEPSIENLSAALALIEGYSLRGNIDPTKLHDMAAYDLKPRLQRVPGVYKIVVMGGKILEYSIKPNPAQLIKYNLTLDDLETALKNNNVLASPGVVNMNSQELVIHENGQFADANEIANLVVTIKSGTPIRMKDIAHVSEGYAYERGDASEDGEPAVLINIYKQPNFDTGKVAAGVAREIESFRQSLPKGATITNYYDQAQLVSDSIGSVKESVWIGGLLVVLVLAFFLKNIRTTVIATLSIPISVVAAIVLMRAFNVGLNIMSLGGLAIGTGIIVDDTIVVLENIFRWLSSPELRKDLPTANVIIAATKEVLVPVVISTMTNIGIFLPMVFVQGFAGRLFAPVSFTVTFALLASLVVALTVIPVMSYKWLAHKTHLESDEDWLHHGYTKILKTLLKKPKQVLGLAFLSLVCVVFLFKHLDVAFLPALDEGAVLIQTIMPPGTSLAESKRLNRKIENWVKKMPGVITAVRATGHAPGAEDTDNVNHSDIMVKLLPKTKRPVTIDDFISALEEKTSKLPSVAVSYLMPLADKINDALGGVPADIGVDIFGPDLTQLHQYSSELIGKMQSVRGLIDLRPPTDIPVPSLEIHINKKEAGRLGISETSIQDNLEAYSLGLPVTGVREVYKEIPVVIHYTNVGENLNLESVEALPLKTAGGSMVPLEQVASFTYGQIPSEIYHDHMTRKLTITANIKGRNANNVAADIQKAIKSLHLKSGYSWGFSGKYETEQNALSNMLFVMTLAIFIVSLILYVEFRSWAQVFLILLTIPLAAVGAVLSLWITHETLNVSSMIGAIMLIGIVVRNGIMMLDYMNQELRVEFNYTKAIIVAAQKRVRPILMTAAVTILGLVPLSTGIGTGSELQKPLAIAVIGGILTSTLLTLVVLPAAVKFTLGRNET